MRTKPSRSWATIERNLNKLYEALQDTWEELDYYARMTAPDQNRITAVQSNQRQILDRIEHYERLVDSGLD